jgi:shikimate dehydrogenase
MTAALPVIPAKAGMTVPYAEVIGDPIGHSKSPLIHKFWLEKLRLDYDYRATMVASGELPAFLERRLADRFWCGCNVTMPHKIQAAGLVGELVPPAGRIGAVNCILRQGERDARLVGRNTDAAGFLEPLRGWLSPGPGFRFADVVGTGGAALAVTAALDGVGFVVANYGRTWQKALAMRHRLGLQEDALAGGLDAFDRQRPSSSRSSAMLDGGEFGLFVNATPLGMTGYPPLPVDASGWSKETVVYDLVYDPVETPLLAQARLAGLRTVDGLSMLIGQAAVAFELFFAESPPREHDAELRELLTR